MVNLSSVILIGLTAITSSIAVFTFMKNRNNKEPKDLRGLSGERE